MEVAAPCILSLSETMILQQRRAGSADSNFICVIASQDKWQKLLGFAGSELTSRSKPTASFHHAGSLAFHKQWGCPNTIALWGAWLESYQLSRFSFVTPDVRVWRWLPLELFFYCLVWSILSLEKWRGKIDICAGNRTPVSWCKF